jgi:putative ABC transport system permease protein
MIELFSMAYRNIKERKIRSALTVLGIVVGIAAVVALMAIGTGMQESITGELTEMVDVIMVIPLQSALGGPSEVAMFNERDLKDVARISGVKESAGIVNMVEVVKYRREEKILQVVGIAPEDMDTVLGATMEAERGGRILKEGDHKVCMVGHRVANEYFDKELKANDNLKIGGSKFRVAGVIEKQGGFGLLPVDSQIYITREDAKDVFRIDEFSNIFARVRDIGDAERIGLDIKERMDNNHKIDDFAFVITMGSLIGQLESAFGIIQAVLVAIASISLIVAAVGITNTMLMSVMERTHEIGVMKAIGATNRNILSLFLTESGILSLVGGILGCVFGVIGANVISFVLGAAYDIELPTIVRPEVLLIGIIVAIVVGILSGLYPARKASRLSPVEAVRYE